MLNGSLQEKNGIFYACFRIKERNGKVTNHSRRLQERVSQAKSRGACGQTETEKPRHTWYGETELVSLFKSIRGTDMELPVYFGIYFGLRRSEATGMRWSAIDLDGRTMTVCGKVTRCKINGKWCDIYSDELKTEESARTFELNEEHCRYLREWHERQMNNVKKYHLTDADTDFVCVNSVGNRLKLDHVTDKFSELLKKFGMRHIRFHDLRHSCISELAMQFPMAMVQRYAGHANYATTANVYTHVDNAAKLSELDALTQAIPLFGKPTVEKEKEPLNA